MTRGAKAGAALAMFATLGLACGDGADPASAGAGGAASSPQAASSGEGGAGGTASATGGTGSSGTAGAGGSCEDACPAPNGAVTYGCESRFMYGVNYAWKRFGADFGGITTWGESGVAADAASYGADLADMHAHGVSVVRWWVFPDFRSDGLLLDGNDVPTGLGGTAVADLDAALELAAQNDVYLMLCLFSFDAFRPSADVAGVWVPGITPMVTDAGKRGMLLENVVRPLAHAAAASRHADRLIAWDVINEPEWAIAGPSPYGDEDYDPSAELAPVSHAEMETFVAETIAVLRQESPNALVTVGGAAMKWAHAWSQVDVDFYQFHIYDWVDDYWPYSLSPADYGVDDKPVVMGEFPLGGLASADYPTLLQSLYSTGYAGALGWQYDEATAADMAAVQAFAGAQGCTTQY